MVGPQLLHLDVAHLLEEFDRLWQLPGRLVCAGQVVERGERVGVIGPQLLHLRIAHLLEEFDRLRQLPGLLVCHGQVVERDEGIGVIGPEVGFPQLGCAGQELYRPVVFSHATIGIANRFEQFGLQKRLLGEIRLDLVRGQFDAPRGRAVRGSSD